MSQQQQFAADYVDVAERISIFRDKYPEGSLQPADPTQPFTFIEVDGARFIVVVAAAYRTPDDQRPGIGMAQEQMPGRTPYTRGSELQNAETSAWGRAIVAALAADTKKGVASADEVRNRRAEQQAETERVTDAVWYESMERRITACTTVGEVRGLWQEAVDQFADNKLTQEDSSRLQQAMKARTAELKGEAA